MKNHLGASLTILLSIVLLYYGILSIKLLFTNKNRRKIGYILYIISLIAFACAFIAMRAYDVNTKSKLYTWLVAGVSGYIIMHLTVSIFLLFDDTRRFIIWVIRLVKPKKGHVNNETQQISRSKFLQRLGWIGGITLFSSFFIGIKNKYNYQIRRVKIPVNPDLHNAFKDLKIVQISDMHTGSFDNTEAVLRGINMINDENADLILFTGDIVNYETAEIRPYINILKQMRAKKGIYSVLGNHDYGDYKDWNTAQDKIDNLNELIKIQKEQLGWKLLMNSHETISINGKELAIIGVENWGANMRFPKYGKLKEAYKGLSGSSAYKILLSHDPSHWDAEIKPNYSDINLTLSGHTHGMQFGIDLSWFKWSPSQYVYKQWAGMYHDKQQLLYVNRGFGFLGYRGRVGILPEITVFTFESM